MDLSELKNIVIENDGDSSVSVKFNRLEREFTDTDRYLLLYSDVKYTSDKFNWDAVLPTVKIPYRDPSMGFLVGGVNFSSVSVYQRAPGVVVEADVKGPKGYKECVSIITKQNTTLGIKYRRNGIMMAIRRRSTERYIPIGIFLKAFSGLPYAELLKRFAMKSPALATSFPCEVPKRAVDLARVRSYGIDSMDEPSAEDCINMTYHALMQSDPSQSSNYSVHWKFGRIKNYFNSIKFKTVQNYETTLAIHARAIGTYLEKDLHLPIYKDVDGILEETEFFLPKGTFISEEIASELRWYDVSTLHVRTTQNFVLQEDTPMLFRAKGYALAHDIPSLGFEANRVLDEEDIKVLNGTDITSLEVITPTGNKILTRSTENSDVGDFFTIINLLFTNNLLNRDDATQYEIANRVVFDYNRQVAVEVEQTYFDIVAAINGSSSLENLMKSLPKLPNTRLIERLRDSSNKEIAQADITNVMSRAIAEQRSSALVKSAPVQMTEIQVGQYARIDSLHSPESEKIGSVQQLTAMVKINPQSGELEAPYEVVVNGIPTGQIKYISASLEKNKYIAGWNDPLTSETTLARYNGDVTTVACSRVSYRDVSPFCDMSISRTTIPFPEFSQARRSLMGTKMAGQAVPLLFPERPRVSTGADLEVPCLYYTARQIVESTLGKDVVIEGEQLEVVNVKWTKALAMYTCVYAGHSLTFSVPFTATDKGTLYNYNLNYSENNTYGLDTVVFYNQSCDLQEHNYWERIDQGTLPFITKFGMPAMALGTNLVVAYKTYQSSTIDDAVVINSRLVGNQKLSNIQIFKYDYELREDEHFDPRVGVVAVHSYVYPGDPVITIIRTTDKGVREKYVKTKYAGEIMYAEISDSTRKAEVWVADIHDAAVGDKVAGRHGNKSVIARIVPDEEMPYDPTTGAHIDIICNPLGIPSRMNYGQVLEVKLGAVMGAQDKYAIVTPFYPNIKQEVVDLYDKAGLHMTKLYNPTYGKYSERPVMVGVMYFFKLEQIANDKLKAVCAPTSVDPVFNQPIKSTNRAKGQAIGEMETWALAAAGANTTLNNLFSLYSSDYTSRKAYFDLLEANKDTSSEEWDESTAEAVVPRVANISSVVTQTVVRMFGQDIQVIDNKYQFVPLNLDDIPIEISSLTLKNNNEKIDEFEWCKVKLHAPVVNPFWINNFPLKVVLGVPSIKHIVEGKRWINIYSKEVKQTRELTDVDKANMVTGIDAIIGLLKITSIDSVIARLSGKSSVAVQTVPDSPVLDHLDLEDSESDTNPQDTVDIDDSDIADFAESELEKLGLSENDIKASEDVNASGDGESEMSGEVREESSRIDPGITTVITGDRDFDELFDVPIAVADIVRFLQRMRDAGMDLKDLVWDYMPILPKVFRQSTITNGIEHEHSFQKQLRFICEFPQSQEIYQALLAFIGYGETKRDSLISLRGYFFGKDSESGQHGHVRSSVLGNRIGFSGRTVIVPATDISMSPYFVGIPWRAAMMELSRVLSIRMLKRSTMLDLTISEEEPQLAGCLQGLKLGEWEELVESLGSYNHSVFTRFFPNIDYSARIFLYHRIREEIRNICEGNVNSKGYVRYKGEWIAPEDFPAGATMDAAVVIFGRQPTHHKKSIRASFMKLVDGDCLQIHPIICTGFNADFDGDQMWSAQLLGEMKNESWKTLSVLQDLISEKDGSYTLTLAQDVALGLYCASVFKDNTVKFVGKLGDYYFFDDIDVLRNQLEYGDLHYYDVVLYRHVSTDRYYLSTAGRVLLNASVPGALLSIPFKDTWGILEQVLGEQAPSGLCQLRYDMDWVVTGITPDDRPAGIKMDTILKTVYHDYGSRPSIDTAQALYEIGLVASDIYSVSSSTDDMSVDVDIEQFMNEPKEQVSQLNSLEQMGLISEKERRTASVQAWDRARKQAMSAVIHAIPENSNVHFLMYSGARSKPDQIMQTVGFIGSVSKTATEDIEYPILRGYGAGLSSLDLCQTREMTRMGAVATQLDTKKTGYAERQTVYMVSGMTVKEEDCGISNCVVDVQYSDNSVKVVEPSGEVKSLTALLSEFADPASEQFANILSDLSARGYALDEDAIESVLLCGYDHIDLVDRVVGIKYCLDEDWKRWALESQYSYALPYTKDGKVTEASLTWVEDHGLRQVIMFDEETWTSKRCFDTEAYLPVDYNTLEYTLYRNGESISEESVYGVKVDSSSEKYKYYARLLGDNGELTVKALQYLTKKKVRNISLVDGDSIYIRYKIASLFEGLVLGRVSVGLPLLENGDFITKNTIDEVQRVQLDYIPVRTSLTCTTVNGVCSRCHGKSITTGTLVPVGTNVGVPAAQAQCEPLSQATLNVIHSGGRRNAGVGLIAGLKFYTQLLSGKLVTKDTADLLEVFSPVSGYVKTNPSDNRFFQLENEDGTVITSIPVPDPERSNVVDKSYIDKGDTIIAGLPRLERYSAGNRNIFQAALNTRYLLMQEYNRVFAGLNVSPRNYELLARAQTTICYLHEQANLPLNKDTSVEIREPTGCYELNVAMQPEVVNKYSGIAGFAFEDVAFMLKMASLNPDGLPLNSFLGNLVTGTTVGSTIAKFIPKRHGTATSKYKESRVGRAYKNIREISSGRYAQELRANLMPGEARESASASVASLLDRLEAIDSAVALEAPDDSDMLSLEEVFGVSPGAPAIEGVSNDSPDFDMVLDGGEDVIDVPAQAVEFDLGGDEEDSVIDESAGFSVDGQVNTMDLDKM